MKKNNPENNRWKNALRDLHDELFNESKSSLKDEFSEYIDCPVCGSSNSQILFKKDGFQYMRCNNCLMVYMNPRLNVKATHSFYNSIANQIYNETKFNKQSPSTKIDNRINYENFLLIDQLRNHEPGTILEIGSASGYFLSKALEKGYEIYGLELNKENFEYSRKLLGNTIYNLDLTDVHFKDGMFDVVYMRDVIEHIPNIREFCSELQRIIKPGGLIFAETHNIDGLIHKVVRERHNVIFGFEHPNHWSPKTLSLLFEQFGFSTKKVIHVSRDFTFRNILNYYLRPSFTTIYPKPVSNTQKFIVKTLMTLFRFKFISWIDKNTMPHIANFLKMGSVMKVISQKTEEPKTHF